MLFHNRKPLLFTLWLQAELCRNFYYCKTIDGCGLSESYFDEPAQVYIINTCSVTENADKECKLHVKRAAKTNPEGLVAVIGCYAQLKPEEISGLKVLTWFWVLKKNSIF
jgi:threonylcarbamoyladenosine tRNA methylthiotransferase MtaB